MEDFFDPWISLLRKGSFLFPVDKSQKFSCTSQADTPRFVASRLPGFGVAVGDVIDFVDPVPYSLFEVERLLAEAYGLVIRATPKFPVFHIIRALLPHFRTVKHRFSSVIPLLKHFDRNGYFSVSGDMQGMFPEFRMMSLYEHLRTLVADAEG